ncbi:LOW QUALITY PROTEIN: aquaporin-12-like [Sceloporus undulatus]|uniref:LOW QUALITY PROTEIN: aquaporin-12-like n=1 Tax=Sceloporus undulatus TaxID=8520 RepID=UPI001C4B6D7C|nr:LOW QUALITY PROTEIN: aquaporin-12-like [Sceloporus undulatus]
MAGLNVSIAFFFFTVGLCEVIRKLSKRIFPPKVYTCLAAELISAFQMCACYLELKMLREIGPWGGGFGPDVSLTLLFLLFLIHGASFSGASANPSISLQEFLALDSSFGATVTKVLAQFMGMEAASAFTKQYWSRELTDFHMIQNLMAQDCSSSLNTSVSHGIFVEAICSFFFQLTILRFQASSSMYRITIVALTVTALAHAAASLTGAFFNPALAFAVTFSCSGNSLLEYMQVYWLAPITGMLIAFFVYQGNIPRVFQKNLLYSIKNKYRIPKGKVNPNASTSIKET